MNEIFVDITKGYFEGSCLEITAVECETIFEEMAKTASSFEDLQNKVKNEFKIFQVNKNFERWTEKLALDRNKLIEVSKNFGK